MCPRTAKQFAEMRKDTRDRILDASFELFARKGFHGTSVSAIAQKAKVSKGLMYNYFGNKEALLQAIISDMFSAGEREMGTVLESDRDAWHKLEALIRLSFQVVAEQPEHSRLLIGLAVKEEFGSGIRLVLKQKMAGYLAVIKPIFRELGVSEPDKELYFLVSILDGYSMHMLTMQEDLMPAEEMIDYIIEQLKRKYMRT